MCGELGWSSDPAKLVGWPLQLKSGTAADFKCKLCLKNQTKMQRHLTLGYFVVQYHFALHPPFKIDYIILSLQPILIHLCSRISKIISCSYQPEQELLKSILVKIRKNIKNIINLYLMLDCMVIFNLCTKWNGNP
jgi:hypothetical protein